MSNASRLRRLRPYILGLIAVLLVGGIVYLAGTDRLSLLGSRSTSAAAGLTPSSPPIDRLRAAAAGANLVICVIDAARADHVGCYGYPRDTTPNIDRLAEHSFVFENHFCQYPETKVSTASLFTSQYPDTHLAYGARTIPESTLTLAQGLRAAGRHTVLFSQNGYASPMWELGRHFHEAYYEPHLKKAGRDLPDIWKPEALLELIGEWLESAPRTPFFAYVHFMPPHDPYIAPPETKYFFADKTPPDAWQSPYPFADIETVRRKAARPWSAREQHRMVNLYDGHLRYADWAVGELERLLDEAGLFETTLFIVTADHGEAFGEHGYRGHTLSVYDETIHIPLVVAFPGADPPAGRIPDLTQSIDLMPTIFDLLQVTYPGDGVQGRSLVPVMAGQRDELNDYIFARGGGQPPSYAVRNHSSLLLLYRGGELRALYDLEDDPRQVHNAIGEQPERAAELEQAFNAFAHRQKVPPLHFTDPDAPAPEFPDVPQVEVTDEMRRALKALGYLR